MTDQELMHHGILGQKWNDRNGPPYPLNSSDKSAAERRAEKKDTKWAVKNEKKIRKTVNKRIEKDMDEYLTSDEVQTMRVYNADGSLSRTFMNAYNQKMASLMNQNVSDLKAPSGRAVQFVAKRGNIGVYMALADAGYDMSQLKNGVYGSGKIGYKKKTVDMVK